MNCYHIDGMYATLLLISVDLKSCLFNRENVFNSKCYVKYWGDRLFEEDFRLILHFVHER